MEHTAPETSDAVMASTPNQIASLKRKAEAETPVVQYESAQPSTSVAAPGKKPAKRQKKNDDQVEKNLKSRKPKAAPAKPRKKAVPVNAVPTATAEDAEPMQIDTIADGINRNLKTPQVVKPVKRTSKPTTKESVPADDAPIQDAKDRELNASNSVTNGVAAEQDTVTVASGPKKPKKAPKPRKKRAGTADATLSAINGDTNMSGVPDGPTDHSTTTAASVQVSISSPRVKKASKGLESKPSVAVLTSATPYALDDIAEEMQVPSTTLPTGILVDAAINSVSVADDQGYTASTEPMKAAKVHKPKTSLDVPLTITLPAADFMDVNLDSESASFHGSPHVISSPATPVISRDKTAQKKALGLAIPTMPPVEAFNCEMPPKVTSWSEQWPAPTDTFPSPVPCPINWDYVCSHTEGLNDGHIQAYVLRAPWNPEEKQMPFATVLKEVNRSGVTSVSVEEAVRKRFKMANIKVYEATGVYFENNVKGVDRLYGLMARKNRPKPNRADHKSCKRAEDFDILTDENNKQKAAPTYAFILQPPKQIYGDRCLKCCEEGFCYDDGCRKDDCCGICCEDEWLCKKCRYHGNRLDNCVNPICGYIECQCPCKHISDPITPKHSTEQWQEVLSQKHAPFGCPEHEPVIVRDVVQGLLDKVSLRSFGEITLLRVEPKAFDLFTSCIVLGLHNGVPHRLLRLSRRDPANPYEDMIYESAGDHYTLGDLFKAYCCAQALQCPSVSVTLLNQIFVILREEDEFTDRQRAGQIKEDTPDLRFRILDFTPEDLHYVYCNTTLEDPIRLLLLDILTYKKEDGRKKVQDHEQEYHPEFLKHWTAREFRRKQGELSAAFRGMENMKAKRGSDAAAGTNAAPWDGQIGLAESHIAAMQKQLNLEPMPKQIAELYAQANTKREEASLIGDMVQVNLDIISLKHIGYMALKGIIWGSCLFQGWFSKIPVLQSGTTLSDGEIDERLSQIQTYACLFSKDEEVFCRTYHDDCAKDSPCLHRVVTPPVYQPDPPTRHDRPQQDDTNDSNASRGEVSPGVVYQSIERDVTPFGSRPNPTATRSKTVDARESREFEGAMLREISAATPADEKAP